MNPNEVQTWSGLPMDPENFGCVLTRGTPFCQIGDSRNFEGTVYLSQSQIELVGPGDEVYLKTKAFPNVTLRGIISEVGSSTNLELPNEVAISGIVPTRTSRNGRLESAEPVFLAKLEIASESLQGYDSWPLHHSMARVAIQIDSQSLGERIARFVFSTFAIDPTVKRRLSL
jgi:hypothetical protein